MDSNRRIVDCHTHFVYDNLKDDKQIDNLIKESIENNVDYFLYASDRFEIFDNIIKRGRQYKQIKPVLGIYPDFAQSNNNEYIDKSIEYIKAHINEIYGIGEIGLDYHYTKEESLRQRQKEVFIKFINLARELNLPIVVHSRDASLDTFDIIKKYCTNMKVYIHCYSSSVEFAKEFVKLPCYIYFGIGGVLTFSNAKALVKVVKEIDIKHFVSETDSPYLAPTPYRGQMNKSYYIHEVIKKISEIKEIDLDATYKIIYENGKRLFDL